MSCRLFLCWLVLHILVLGRWAGRYRNDLSLYLGWRIRSWVGWPVTLCLHGLSHQLLCYFDGVLSLVVGLGVGWRTYGKFEGVCASKLLKISWCKRFAVIWDDLIWVPCFAKWSLTLRMTDSCHAFRCPAFIYNSTHGVRKRGQL